MWGGGERRTREIERRRPTSFPLSLSHITLNTLTTSCQSLSVSSLDLVTPRALELPLPGCGPRAVSVLHWSVDLARMLMTCVRVSWPLEQM